MSATADLLQDAAQRAATYLSTQDDRSVAPTADALACLHAFDEPFPDGPLEAAAAIDLLDRIGSPATVASNGPRYFGFVTGGAQPAAMAAAVLATAWDQNAALPVMSPAAAAIDRVAASWVLAALGLPAEATATFCGGASEANLIAMITARDEVLRRVGWDVPANGLVGAPAITVVASEETHGSMKKAVALAGLGRDRMVLLPADDQGRLRADAMPAIVGPTIVSLQAGNVNTGHSDPFSQVVRQVQSQGAWVHVDGAFGLWAAAAPERASLVTGMEAADSWATDAHKWLNVPYDNAVAIVADGDALARSMRADRAYLPSSSDRAPMQLGLQMSQRARAVPVWAALRSMGRSGLADLVEQCCAQASRLSAALATGGAKVLHDVVLNQALVSFGDAQTTNAVIAAVQAEGTCWAGGTIWQGQTAMRLSVSGAQTTNADIDASAEAILRCWSELL
ncbi:MAG: glutamate/tyrosine decarboxylase-like PLP-dependent enzyme [Acidimicrobiales bacterium]|jgi:glutamate/tyrosine decarboxylase-like PLP-dependent enzyme